MVTTVMTNGLEGVNDDDDTLAADTYVKKKRKQKE